ncbi:TonB-dependent receptor domain-containing protein [Sphingobium yanoikuyae]|uniref:TonB-dependent receptor domain-containing protein n=1 Tax=Sphingobium yanoikuyae TaxID=13690 RepID=UPI00345E5F68
MQALPVDGVAARALGAQPLKPEKSTNFSAGIVLTPAPNFNVTVDAYQIKVRDRILLSETLSGPVVMDALAAAGIQGIAGGLIFSNAADTRTPRPRHRQHLSGRAGRPWHRDDQPVGQFPTRPSSPISTRSPTRSPHPGWC